MLSQVCVVECANPSPSDLAVSLCGGGPAKLRTVFKKSSDSAATL